MKKLMFTLLAAVGLSAVSHGASFYWGTESSADLAEYANDTVYCLLASDWAGMDPKSAQAVQDAALSSAGYTKARTKYGIGDTSFNYGADNLASLDVVFVDINSAGEYFTWTQTLTGNDPANAAPTKQTYTASQMAGFKSADGGYKAFGGGGGSGGDEPEPTSGLLMLVGLGVLGLRRKMK